MKTYIIRIFIKTTDQYIIRLVDTNNQLISERFLSNDNIFTLLNEINNVKKMPTLNYEEIGNILYSWLNDNTEFLFEKILKSESSCEIQFDLIEELQELPWELLFYDTEFALTNPTKLLSVTRLSQGSGSTYKIANRALRILFMACSPENTSPLNFEYEERMIIDSTQKFGIELVIEESGTLSGLKEMIEFYGKGYFDIFHLTGHADIINNKPCFLMEDEFGSVKCEDANSICRAFSSFWPKMIFLSGCKTALYENNVSSLSHSLVCAGAPIVLGWADPVGDNVATKLSSFLYREIALGKKINEAIATSRALLYETELKLKNYKKYWPLFRVYNTVSELSEIVTPFRTKGRGKPVKREAILNFLDAGAQVEVCGARNFVGRRCNIQRCLQVLTSIQGDNSYAEGIVIFGMNGLGKTSMAARLCERMPEYKQFIFVGKIDEAEIIRNISDKLSCSEVNEILSDDKLKLKNRLMLVFEKFINNTPSIFVFDNFEINLEFYNSDIKLKQEAYEIINAILAVIHNSSSDSRVIITSSYAFEIMRPFKLHFECLESIRGADLDKKLSYLLGIQNQNQEVIQKILKICDGNIKLLQNINNILLKEDINENEFDNLLDTQINKYLYESNLYELIVSLPNDQRKLLAIISIFDIPISLNWIKEMIDYNILELHLQNIIRSGLVEERKSNNMDNKKYYTSNYIKKLVDDEIPNEERNKLIKKCVQYLYNIICKNKHIENIEELQELHRLSLISKDEEIVTEIGNYLAYFLNNDAQHEKAEKICIDILSLYNNSNAYHNLAIAKNAMGNTQDAIKNYKLALNVLDSNGDNDINFNNEKANISINFAATNMFIGEVEKSKRLIEDAEKIFIENEDLVGQAAVLNINGICDIREGQVEKGLDKLQNAYKLIESTGNLHYLNEILNSIATVYANKGEFEEAFKLWKQVFEYRTKTGDKRGEARIINSIASAYAMQGNIDIALNMLDCVYSMQKSVGDLNGEAISLANKASIIKDKGNIDEALKLLSQAYDINENIENLKGQASNLDNMALLYLDKGDSEKAIRLWGKAMVAYEKLNDISGQSSVMNNMGIEIKRKDQKKALEFFNKALFISEECGNKREMSISLSNIAFIVGEQGDKIGALQMLKKTLLFQESIKDIRGQAITKNNMAGLYENLNNEEEALTLWNESLTLNRKINNLKGIATVLSNMAGLIVKMGDTDRAIKMLYEAFELQKKVEDAEGQAFSLSEIAKIIIKSDEETALNYWEQAILIQNRIGDIYGKALTLMGMGECFKEKKNTDKAIEKLKQSQAIFEEYGNDKYNANVLFKIAKILQKSQGIDEAVSFFEKAYIVEQKLGNIERQADSLNEIAVTIYQRDLNLAYNKWEKALELYKKCKGLEVQVSATLNNMATVLAKQGLLKSALIKCEQALEIQESLNSWNETKKIVKNLVGMTEDLDDDESKRYFLLRASRAYAKNDSWQELFKILIVIGDIDNEACYFAQALWLALHIPISEQFAIINIISLVEIVGMENEMAPLLASSGLLFIGPDKKDICINEKIAKNVSVILEGCAKVRNIEDGEFKNWIIENNLHKPQENILLIKELLTKLVGKNSWVFDHEAFINK